VAYAMCPQVDIDADDYSLPYVAQGAVGDIKLIQETAERVVTYCALNPQRRAIGGDGSLNDVGQLDRSMPSPMSSVRILTDGKGEGNRVSWQVNYGAWLGHLTRCANLVEPEPVGDIRVTAVLMS